MLEALGFFALAEVVGLAAVPLAGLAFGRLPGAGLGFAKPLGLLLVTWAVWIAGSIGLAPYGTATVLGAAALMALAGGLVAGRESVLRSKLAAAHGQGLVGAPAGGGAGRAGAAGPRPGAAADVDRAPSSSSPRRSSGWSCSSPTRPTCGGPRSRWTWRS